MMGTRQFTRLVWLLVAALLLWWLVERPALRRDSLPVSVLLRAYG